MRLKWKRFLLRYEPNFYLPITPSFTREVIFLHLSDAYGLDSIGEIAPLPNWGTETLEESEGVLREVSYLLSTQKELPPEIEEFFPNIPFSRYPATAFGLSTLFRFYHLKHFQSEEPDLKESVAVSGTAVWDDDNRLFESISYWNEIGCNTIKIKVIAPMTSNLFEKMLMLVEQFSHTIFRFDLNEKWDFEGTKEFLQNYFHPRIQYLEQPLPRTQKEKIRQLTLLGTIPIAVDESATTLETTEFWIKESNAYVIVKPCTLGSIQKIERWFDQHLHQLNRLVFSSTFESKLSALWYATLLQKYHTIQLPSGIATFLKIQNDVIQQPVQVQNGNFIYPKNWMKSVCFEPQFEMMVRSTNDVPF